VGVHSSGSLDMSGGPGYRQQNSRSLQTRDKNTSNIVDHQQESKSSKVIYANHNGSSSGVHLRPSSAIRYQQHHQQQIQFKVKNQTSNIKIKAAGGGSKHGHNQSVSVATKAKNNMTSIDNSGIHMGAGGAHNNN